MKHMITGIEKKTIMSMVATLTEPFELSDDIEREDEG